MRPAGAAARASSRMRETFEGAVRLLERLLRPGESFTAHLAAGESGFVRFNRSRVRQAGSVSQAHLTVDWAEGRRHAAGTVTLSGDAALDRRRLRGAIERLRERRAHVPEDPWLLAPDEPRSSDDVREATLPDPAAAVAAILDAGRDRDLVGLFASGPIHAGFADSRGQRNWHTVGTFHLDWSFHPGDDRAAKGSYAGTRWDDAAFAAVVARTARELEATARPAAELALGPHRVFLAPAAVHEILGLLGWGGFGLRAHRTRTTPLLRMVEEGARLHPAVSIVENAIEGVAPRFQEAGFPRPDRVVLIEGGELRGSLVSPRSAAEYGAPCNGAAAAEMPQSAEIAAGDLVGEAALGRLGDGVWIGNVHYLNFSDAPAGRITGLTRFATFRVRGGEIAAPVRTMRFDESVFRFLGDGLLALTREREWTLDPDTYGRRSTASTLVPGLLVEDFRFVL